MFAVQRCLSVSDALLPSGVFILNIFSLKIIWCLWKWQNGAIRSKKTFRFSAFLTQVKVIRWSKHSYNRDKVHVLDNLNFWIWKCLNLLFFIWSIFNKLWTLQWSTTLHICVISTLITESIQCRSGNEWHDCVLY